MKVTKDTIKPGMLLKTHGGYTMRHAKFFAVIHVKGCKVTLGNASIKTHADQWGQAGRYELLGSGDMVPAKNAKFTVHGLSLADKEFKVEGYFRPLEVASVGDTEEFYGD